MKPQLHVLVRPPRCLIAMYGYMCQHVGRCGGLWGTSFLGQTLTRSLMERKVGILCAPKNHYIIGAVTVRSRLSRVFLSHLLCDRLVFL
jgi:hypothetical protein